MRELDCKKERDIEEWKDISGFEGKYRISNFGNAIRVFPSGKTRNMTPYRKQKGKRKKYLFLKLTNSDGVSKEFLVHQLVARHYLPTPKAGEVPYHKNHVLTDNWKGNLVYIDRSSLGKMTGARSGRMPVAKVNLSGEKIEFYTSAREASRKNHVSYQCVMDHCNGRVKRAHTLGDYEFVWDDEEVSLRHALQRIEAGKNARMKYIRANPGSNLQMEFQDNTTQGIKNALMEAKKIGLRIRIFYGDPETGEDSLAEFDTVGYVYLRKEAPHYPILIYDKGTRSGEGALIKCQNVMKVIICDKRNKRVLYENPHYYTPALEIKPPWKQEALQGFSCRVDAEGKTMKHFHSKDRAQNYINWIEGTINRKTFNEEE